MTDTIEIGSSVLYEDPLKPSTGVWSAIVTSLYNTHHAPSASITFDGVVVPPMYLCGIQGPYAGTNTCNVEISELRLRSTEPEDEEKRQQWATKVEEYRVAQAAFYEAQLAMERQRFSHVTPGMAVTWQTKADKFKGSIVSVEKSGLAAYVKGTADGIEHTVRIMLKRLTFI